ncbi:hypothetical protein F1880_004314 [Penicillium rolfsii]|nr:hypothetical protein F1880_004314 [Penicillium rolfsii]
MVDYSFPSSLLRVIDQNFGPGFANRRVLGSQVIQIWNKDEAGGAQHIEKQGVRDALGSRRRENHGKSSTGRRH